jgi:type IV fimbrial biogenesis protein FimT
MVACMNLVASMRLPRTPGDPTASSRGFTLVELLTVMTIVAILMALGVPSYQYVTSANRISGEVNGLLGDMQYARSEAIKEGQTVTVCSSSNSTTAAPTCSGSTSWQNGWIVFADANGNATVDAQETILRVQKPFKAGDTFVANPGTNAVTFNREGFALNINNAITVTLHAPTATTGSTRCLRITIVGQLITQTAGQGACT